MNKDTFCSLAFSGIFLGSDGNVKPCCSMRGNFGNINERTIEDIVQGPVAQEVRQHMIDNKWHPMCSQCRELESKGARSERMGDLSPITFFKDATAKTFVPQRIDIRWSNTCNLSCNYCTTYFSSKWAEIKNVKVNANKATAEQRVIDFIRNNVVDSSNLNVNMLGGEPLLLKQNVQLINAVPNANFYVLSNLSSDIETSRVFKQLMDNKKVAFGISFETVGPKFEYVRHGANWDKFVSNLRYVSKQKINGFDAHPIYCVYSAFNLVDYYDFVDSEGYFTGQYWQLLQNIAGLDVFKLPHPLKIKALKELERCFSKYEHKYDMSSLRPIYEKLKVSINEPFQEKSKEALDWLNELDRYIPGKKQKYIDLWPDVYVELLKTESIIYTDKGEKPFVYMPKAQFDQYWRSQGMSKRMFAFGDSFVQGDQDDFLHDHPPEVVPEHDMGYHERINYLRNHVSFASIIARRRGYEYENYAERGSGNFPQLDKLWKMLREEKIKKGDLVLFGITTMVRDRASANVFDKAREYSWGECIVDREMLRSENYRSIWEADLFYLLSVLKQLEITYGIRIIKFNLFDNCLDEAEQSFKDLIKNTFTDYLGSEFIGNTLIDILNDTWGSNNKYPYHTMLNLPKEYLHLYTVKKHPNRIGHEKIADWFLKNVNL